MAKCERHDPLPVQPPPPTYTLTLSQDEAQFLFDILGYSVAGSGRRETCSGPIYTALSGVGFRVMPKIDWTGMLHFVTK